MDNVTKDNYKIDPYTLKIRQSYPLEHKLRLSKKRIEAWVDYHGVDGVYVSFSGGKDSTVLLDIVRSIYPEVPAVFVDTGLEYPEIKKFVSTIPNVVVLRPKMRFDKVIETYGYPIISKEVSKFISDYRRKPDGYTAKKFDPNSDYIKKYGKQYCLDKYIPLRDSEFKISSKCCDIMKKAPVHEYYKSTGRTPILATMACESRIRRQQYMINGCNAWNNKIPTSTPIAFWTEQDILQYIKLRNLPYASIYGDIVDKNGRLCTTGCDRTGCMFCCYGVQSDKLPNRFQRMQKTHPIQYEYCINKLGIGKLLDFMKIPYK